MNTDYLKEFVVFAGHMNFTAAAKALNMSQPSLSRHVSELEQRFGCELVDRGAPCLRLTHCGKVLLEQAPELIAQENLLEERMAQARREPYGSLVVERYRKSPLVQSLMSDALSALRQAHPGYAVVRRALKPGDTAAGAVLRGDLDVGVMACTTDRAPCCPVSETEGFGVLELTAWRERIRFVLRRENPLACRPGLTLDELRDCCFVFPLNPEFGRCQPDVARLFAQRGLALRSRPYELNDVEELGLMEIGPGDVFIVVESAANAPGSFYLDNPDLAVVPCAENILVTRYLVYRADDANPVLGALLDEVARMGAAR